MEKIKFKKDSNIIKLSEEIYLYKNFLEKAIADKYLTNLESFSEDQWHLHENYEPGDLNGDYWDGKLSLDIIDMQFQNTLVNYFAPDFWPYQHCNFIRLKTGESADESFEIYNFIDYKIALYLGNFSGGEIFFPKLNVEYKPESNDLLIFKSDINHKHITKTVTSGTRYAYIDFLVKHPGYFMA